MIKRKLLTKAEVITTICVIVTLLISITIINSTINKVQKFEYTSSVFIPKADYKIEYFDVGQADCVYISLPDGLDILIDSGNAADGELIASRLRDEGVDSIEYIFLTHPHEDHIGGAADIINSIKVDKVYMPNVPSDLISDSAVYSSLTNALEDNGLSISYAYAGMTIISSDKVYLRVLSPAEDYEIGTAENMNDSSIVLDLRAYGAKYLFMGDSEKEQEKNILDAGFDVNCDVLYVGHHGSKAASSQSFIQAVSPQYSIISCGPKNRYGHPSGETLKTLSKAGSKTMVTATDGTVTVEYKYDKLSITSDKSLILDGNKR